MATQDFQSEYWPNLAADSLSADPIDLTSELDGYVQKSGDTMTGPLVVPDATADGQALAQGQAGDIRLGQGGGDNVTLTTSLYVHGLSGGSTIWFATETQQDQGIRWSHSDNSWTNQFAMPGSKLQQRWHPTAGVRFEDLVTFASDVVVPAPADGATQAAAQVTAKDSTTGQLQIGGVEMGDTGVRDVSADLLNGYTGTLTMRRVGNIIYLTGSADGTASTTSTFFNLPTGFRVAINRYADGSFPTSQGNDADVSLRGSIFSSSACGFQGARPSSVAGIHWIFEADEAWPTSLPGTPA